MELLTNSWCAQTVRQWMELSDSNGKTHCALSPCFMILLTTYSVLPLLSLSHCPSIPPSTPPTPHSPFPYIIQSPCPMPFTLCSLISSCCLPQVVDLLIAMANAASISQRARIILDPYPSIVDPSDHSSLVMDPKVSKIAHAISNTCTGVHVHVWWLLCYNYYYYVYNEVAHAQCSRVWKYIINGSQCYFVKWKSVLGIL